MLSTTVVVDTRLKVLVGLNMDRTSPGNPEDDGIASAAASQDADATFFKVISENLKYAFNSPLPTTQFPTPYSNQTHQQQQQPLQQQQSQNSNMNLNQEGSIGENGANDAGNDSSLVENSMLAGLPMGIATGPSGEPLSDMNMQPSSVLQFGNSFSNEFLLASPEQFREFLLDSPAGFNLFHKTPAKTPLRFVTDSKDGRNSNSDENDDNGTSSIQEDLNGGNSSGGGDLFGIVASKNNNSHSTRTNTTVSNSNQGSNSSSDDNGDTNNMGHLDGSSGIRPITTTDVIGNENTQTPLKSIDLNLMFNSNQLTASSPSKKLSVSLTPYGRRVLNDVGTPYAKNALISSNSALADFQKARKHNVKLQSTPPTTLGSSNHRSMERNKTASACGPLYRDHDPLAPPQEENDENGVYGSSPTTIQLNSSVTKSTIKLEPGRAAPFNKLDSSTNNSGNSNSIGGRLFVNDEDRLPLSPTPKCHNINAGNDNGLLKIPELPKMGSFKSDSSSLSSASSNMSHHNSNHNHNSKPGKVKKNTKKQPKFQIIVANTQKFNVPTMNQRSSKKNTGLKRSQSLLSNPSASNLSNKSQQRSGGISSGGNATNNSDNGSNTNVSSMNGNKRSISFTSGKRQFNGFQ